MKLNNIKEKLCITGYLIEVITELLNKMNYVIVNNKTEQLINELQIKTDVFTCMWA